MFVCFFISVMLEERISGFGDAALKRVFFKVCCVFLLSQLLLIFINPAVVTHKHTLKQKHLDQTNVRMKKLHRNLIEEQKFQSERWKKFQIDLFLC